MNNKALIASNAIKRGFTLIEILMVILIIALLMAFIVPQVLNGRATANDAIRINHLKQLSLGISSYITDERKIPSSDCITPTSTLGDLLIKGGYLEEKNFPKDPGTISTCGSTGGYQGEQYNDGGSAKYRIKAKMETKAKATEGDFYVENVQ